MLIEEKEGGTGWRVADCVHSAAEEGVPEHFDCFLRRSRMES